MCVECVGLHKRMNVSNNRTNTFLDSQIFLINTSLKVDHVVKQNLHNSSDRTEDLVVFALLPFHVLFNPRGGSVVTRMAAVQY